MLRILALLGQNIFQNFPDVVQAHRLVGFRCLAHCVRNYAQNRSADSDLPQRLGKLLDPAVAAVRKGTIAQHPAHLRVMHDLCVECISYAPLYFTQLLVLLMHHEMWECVIEGVRACIDVMVRSAARLSQASLAEVLCPLMLPESSLPRCVCLTSSEF